jgi:hypothetical protein
MGVVPLFREEVFTEQLPRNGTGITGHVAADPSQQLYSLQYYEQSGGSSRTTVWETLERLKETRYHFSKNNW